MHIVILCSYASQLDGIMTGRGCEGRTDLREILRVNISIVPTTYVYPALLFPAYEYYLYLETDDSRSSVRLPCHIPGQLYSSLHLRSARADIPYATAASQPVTVSSPPPLLFSFRYREIVVAKSGLALPSSARRFRKTGLPHTAAASRSVGRGCADRLIPK